MEVKIIGTPEEISKLHQLILNQTEKTALLRDEAIKVISKFIDDFGLDDEEIEKSLKNLKTNAI